MPGFKTSRAMSVVVNVSEAPDLDAQLEGGTSEERVDCQCQLRETATSSTGTLVDSRTITAVPLTTRNLTQVLSMSSGSTASVNNAGMLGAARRSVIDCCSSTPHQRSFGGDDRFAVLSGEQGPG